jgi:hypothetical protein
MYIYPTSDYYSYLNKKKILNNSKEILCKRSFIFRLETQGKVFVFMLPIFISLAIASWSNMVKSYIFPQILLLFLLITKITPVALIEIMFLFLINKYNFCFCFYFFSNYTIFYFNIFSGTILLRTTFFSEDDLLTFLYPQYEWK